MNYLDVGGIYWTVRCAVLTLMRSSTHLVSLPDPFVNEVRERSSVNEPSLTRWDVELPVLINHFPSGDGDYGDAVALHALKDVVVHGLVVGLGWYPPAESETSELFSNWPQLRGKIFSETDWVRQQSLRFNIHDFFFSLTYSKAKASFCQ